MTDRDGVKIGVERAKELFCQYHGNRFYMDHDGVGAEYEGYHVSGETERIWTRELVSELLKSEYRGKEALRVYRAAADLLNRDGERELWEECLYYPLRTGKLDDVTVLFTLRASFDMAREAAEKGRFSGEEAGRYRQELERFSRSVLRRAENGTLTRDEDYVMREFSDPLYVRDYLRDIIERWNGLPGSAGYKTSGGKQE